tara:strand:+ start:161 stop:1825 length:1665 start_codon:yes stop_codon:yes gene_type:complete
MPYIGRGISQLQTIDKLDAITPSTSTGAGPYNLTQSSSAFTPISANNLLISINGVVQYGNFTVSGSTVTFTGALSDSDTCNFILHVGEGVVNTPGAGTVTGSSVASSFDISSKTVTLPASVSGLGTGITNSQLAGSIANSKLANSSITINGSAVSLGSSTTIATGIEWQSTIVTGTTLSATANYGYFIDTSSNACTVTLPTSSSVGDELWFVDYSRRFGTNNLTLDQGSQKFQGNTTPNPVYSTDGQAIHIVYSGSTKGWIPTTDDDVTFAAAQTYAAEYTLVAGGASGGSGGDRGGGGGAGGLLTNFGGTTVNLVTGTIYTITVGAGGATVTSNKGNSGNDSTITGTAFSTLTAVGGGYGGNKNYTGSGAGGDGGSGGGAASIGGGSVSNPSGGSGTSGQGNDGGTGNTVSGEYGAGGGGGAGAAGGDGSTSAAGAGGNGSANSITGSSVTYAGGGGGARQSSATGGAGGSGGGGAGGGGDGPGVAGTAGTANTGGGGGGSKGNASGAGGSGVVILSVPDASYSGTTSGSPTVATGVSGKTVITFTGSGSYTA